MVYCHSDIGRTACICKLESNEILNETSAIANIRNVSVHSTHSQVSRFTEKKMEKSGNISVSKAHFSTR